LNLFVQQNNKQLTVMHRGNISVFFKTKKLFFDKTRKQCGKISQKTQGGLWKKSTKGDVGICGLAILFVLHTLS
jgi:hypothetical protein